MNKENIKILIDELNIAENPNSILKALRSFQKKLLSNIGKDKVIAILREYMKEDSFMSEQTKIAISKLKMKPTRTISGVATVTVLTKPYACPGKCVFCPNDIRMPKSYIATEPGAQRGLMNMFNPYSQVINRLTALEAIGHNIDKVELLILGGTWSSYTLKYKIWFVTELYRALNDYGSGQIDKSSISRINIDEIFKSDFNDKFRAKYGDNSYNEILKSKEYSSWRLENVSEESREYSIEDLKKQQEINVNSRCRNVGLVFETRSDKITVKECELMRTFGATKVQLGIQILNDKISEVNKRGETIEQCANAFRLLRGFGFKIHAHIMPNLYMATLQDDIASYHMLFNDPRFCPDEVKIYPTSVIKNTELDTLWRDNKFKPYINSDLINLVAQLMEMTPRYARITRVIRDIPSTEIEGGNMTTNLREVVEHKLKIESRKNDNIRSREIKDQIVSLKDLNLIVTKYDTSVGTEYFFEYVTSDDKICGFIRLAIPNIEAPIDEIKGCALIREVHVYGPVLNLGERAVGESQHIGLGSLLVNHAKSKAKEFGYNKIAVISAIGTRKYYEKHGFILDNSYQICSI